MASQSSTAMNDQREESHIDLSVDVTSYRVVTPSTSSGSSTVPLLSDVISSLGLDQIGQNAPHFVYEIQVRVLQPELVSFDISKRFSELAQLDTALSSMTKFLPYFPPRGAHRVLTDAHAQERVKLLNTYFTLVTRMPEVVQTREFLEFLNLAPRFGYSIPNTVGELILTPPTSDHRLSSVSVSTDITVVALSRSPSQVAQATQFIASMFTSVPAPRGSAQLEVWKRLPNSFLSERAHVLSFPFRVDCTLILDQSRLVLFGTDEGRVGFIRLPSGESGFLPGMVHVGPVSALAPDGDTGVWSGGRDGMVSHFDIPKWKLTVRMSSNAESSAVTSLVVDRGRSVLFVGLSSGVISVFHQLRVVTILQGPAATVASLALQQGLLAAAHSAGLMDSTDEANTVQFWDVSDILTRGTSKLAHWGPCVTSVVGMIPVSGSLFAVAAANGAINIFAHTKDQVTNRARFLIRAAGEYGSVPLHCLGWMEADSALAVGSSNDNTVRIIKLPPFDPSDLDRIDISTPQVCQSVERSRPPVTRTTSSAPPPSQQPDSGDELHSWAR